MSLRGWLGVLLLAGGLANAGCGSNGALTPSGTVTVPLDAAKKRGSITVRVANLVVLTMPPAGPGVAWQISFHDTRYLKLYSDLLPPKTDGEGSTVSFLALQPGSTRLRFMLVPVSPDRAVNPVDQQEVVVQIR